MCKAAFARTFGNKEVLLPSRGRLNPGMQGGYKGELSQAWDGLYQVQMMEECRGVPHPMKTCQCDRPLGLIFHPVAARHSRCLFSFGFVPS